MFKKWDIVVIVILIIISFTPEIVFSITNANRGNDTYAEITVEGKVYKKIELFSHHGQENIDIKTKYGYNIIHIKDNEIAVTDADCRDKICIKQGYIHKVGQTIACMPHKLLIEIKSSNDDDIIMTN